MMTIEPNTYTLRLKEISNIQEFLNSTKCELGDYAKQFAESEYFLTKNKQEEVKIRLVKFDKDYLITDILKEIDSAGYRLPEAEEAIWFAAQYPDAQREFPIAFLHKPWVRPETGGENVLILRTYDNHRYVHMHLFDSRWYSHVRFAVIER